MQPPIALHQCVIHSLEHYFAMLDGQMPTNLHAIVVQEVERPLLAYVMQQTGNNQKQAAQWLGINRNTLRKKLEYYGLHPTQTGKGEESHA